MTKTISVVTPCFNEEGNVEELYRQVKAVFEDFPQYRYEHLFIDNASVDQTPRILRALAANDPNVKVIFNARNFGQIRSPYYGLFQAHGDAVVMIVADLQEPPSLIKEFILCWEQGYKLALGVKNKAHESRVLFVLRKIYYALVNNLSDIQLVQNFNGFALYDRQVVDTLKSINDPYPYVRGLISEIGFDKAIVYYTQAARKRGLSKNNFLTLYDYAMLGLTTHTKLPIRVAVLIGFALAFLCLCVSMFYLVMKLLFWNAYPMGFAPIAVGMFFFMSVQLIFIGLLGEYILSIHNHVRNIPMVVEKERLNF